MLSVGVNGLISLTKFVKEGVEKSKRYDRRRDRKWHKHDRCRLHCQGEWSYMDISRSRPAWITTCLRASSSIKPTFLLPLIIYLSLFLYHPRPFNPSRLFSFLVFLAFRLPPPGPTAAPPGRQQYVKQRLQCQPFSSSARV